MRKQINIIANEVKAYSGPSFNKQHVDTIKYGEDRVITETITDSLGQEWYKIEESNKWIPLKSQGGKKNNFTIIKDLPPIKTPGRARDIDNTPPGEEDQDTQEPTDEETPTIEFDPVDVEEILSNMKSYSIDDLNNRMLGLPYQFLDTADIRIDNNQDIGRLFAQNIFAEAPIVNIVPGKANFLPDYKERDKDAFKQILEGVEQGDPNADSALKKLVDDEEESRYFDFTTDYAHYIKYVNLLCRTTSLLLGIGDLTPPGLDTPYRNFDWGNYKYFNSYEIDNGDGSFFNDFIRSVDGSQQYLSIYVDPSTSFSESTSNETSKSALEGKFDEMQSKIKEASFFMEANALGDFGDSVKGWVTEFMDSISSIGTEGGFLDSLLGKGKQQIVYGSNLIFPEIWQDSQYSKSYTINTTFVSPYGDKESVYLNCLVPMMHLLALALPHQTTANTYSAPFLVKMFSKGWFSCDMGIVESIQIDKGPDQTWSVDGLPTTIKVTLNVKDLYSQLMLSPSDSPSLFFTNQGMIDFLGATCGVDLSQLNINLKVKIATAIFSNNITDLPDNWYRSLKESVTRKITNLFI